MSRIKSIDTKPEIKFREEIYRLGYRYRVHFPIPGNPDVVFVKKKKVVFINGCFWHRHGCKRSTLPKTNKKYWYNKLDRNVERDNNNYHELLKLGWSYCILWECELSGDLEKAISRFELFYSST